MCCMKEVLYVFAESIFGINSIANDISSSILSTNGSYMTLLTLIQSLSYFCFFTTLNFNSKFINNISSKVFGVYLIHDNNYIRTHLYDLLRISNRQITSYKFILYVIIVMFLIFIVCLVIESIRQLIVYLIKKTRAYKKIRKNYYKFKNDLYLKGEVYEQSYKN